MCMYVNEIVWVVCLCVCVCGGGGGKRGCQRGSYVFVRAHTCTCLRYTFLPNKRINESVVQDLT